MNWAIFSVFGYVSVALCLCMPLLWLVHTVRRPRGWLCHVALGVGIVALVLAKVNSETHVNRIQVDRSDQIEAQMSRQELARKAAEAERADDVAQIRFAEDASGDFLDKAGLDEADLKYFESFDDGATPAWKSEKKARSENADDTSDLESLIDDSEAPERLQPADVEEEPAYEPILMSDEDKTAADRLDAANLALIRLMLVLAVVFVAVDYFRRLNVYEEAYAPLPVPSAWADAMAPRETVSVRPASPRRSLVDELRVIARRGEVFVFMTDDPQAAREAAVPMPRLPGGGRPIDTLAVVDDPLMDDAFVFETLWYGRNAFVVETAERAQPMLERFIELLAERRETRAHAKRTVHVVWDLDTPVERETRRRFESLGKTAGFTLLLCRDTG